jgi:CheY-like chemotaxis protein/anti-sigma regulatory factor (Ser/Thr protein kinase)
MGDAQRLGQILVNLVGNAVKFTEAGAVRVEARVDQEFEDGALVRFEVEDTGVGIAQENTARLFQPFEQIDASSTRRNGGTGLGLAICKRLVQLMHGEIGVHSRLGLGSTFWFTARLGAGQATHQEVLLPSLSDAREQLRREFAEASVLLVEDDPNNQEVLCALLEDAALKVTLADNGASALALVRYIDYALILMDVQMPVLDGIQATRGIRQIPGREHTPIIALTAGAFVQDRNACLDAGMSEHLAKPVDPDGLYGTLLKWLRSKPTMLQV